MTIRPNFKVKGARPGRWAIDLDEIGDDIPVLHYHLLTGMNYRQKCVYPENPKSTAKKAALIERLKQIGRVVITTDKHDQEPWKRTGYVGLFAVSDIEVSDDGYLTFRLGEKIANLIR